jgi:hypothetical protein
MELEGVRMKAEQPKADQWLLLKHESLRQEINGLFDALASNPAARQNFINNPAGVLRAAFSFTHSDIEFNQDDSEANKLLFSIVSNPNFFDFIKERQSKAPTGKPETLKEFAEAYLQFGDPEILAGLLDDARNPSRIYALPPFVLLVLVVVVAFTVLAVAVDSHMVPDNNVSVPDLRSLAEVMAKEAKEARTSGRTSISETQMAQVKSAFPWAIEVIQQTPSAIRSAS